MRFLFLLLLLSQIAFGYTVQNVGRQFTRYSLVAVEADGTNNSETIDLSTFHGVSIQVLHASHDDTSTWELQVSQDGGTTWDTLTGSSTTTSSAAGSHTISIDPYPYGILRLAVTEADGNAAATLTAHVIGKKRGNQ